MEISTSHTNFDPNRLPPGTAEFYNSVQFAENEAKQLIPVVNQEEKAQLRGLREIRKAINGMA